MAPGQRTDPPPEFLLRNRRQQHRQPQEIADLTCQPAGTTLGNPESILQNHHGPSRGKVRLTSQQAPAASQKPFGLVHGPIQFSNCE